MVEFFIRSLKDEQVAKITSCASASRAHARQACTAPPADVSPSALAGKHAFPSPQIIDQRMLDLLLTLQPELEGTALWIAIAAHAPDRQGWTEKEVERSTSGRAGLGNGTG